MKRYENDSYSVRGTSQPVQSAAQELRRQMTPAEFKLWEALKERRLAGLKFRAQHAIGTFILDFYCPEHRLVVEVDGGIHKEQAEHDAARTAHLNAYGYNVIRFTNEEVLTNLTSVLKAILHFMKDEPPIQ